jgi:transposase
VARTEISDEVWVVTGPLFPATKATGRPPMERRAVVEAPAWRYRTGASRRDVPERVRNWSTIYKNFNRWSAQGAWVRVLEKLQSLNHQRSELDWGASSDSTIVRMHQHGATLKRYTGGSIELQGVRDRAP